MLWAPNAQDTKVVESACLALSRIADALALRPEHLAMLCGSGLVANALQLVAVSDAGGMTAQLSVPTYYGLIRLLTTCAGGSAAVAESLLAANMSGTMRSLLAKCARPAPGVASVAFCWTRVQPLTAGMMGDCTALS